MRRNTRRHWTQQTLLVVRIVASGIRLNDAFLKTLLKAAKKTLRQPTTRAEFSYEKLFLGGGGGGGRGVVGYVYLLQPIQKTFGTN